MSIWVLEGAHTVGVCLGSFLCLEDRKGRRSRKRSFSVLVYVCLPCKSTVYNNTKVSHILCRRKWLIVEVKSWAYSVAKGKGALSGFGFIHFFKTFSMFNIYYCNRMLVLGCRKISKLL